MAAEVVRLIKSAMAPVHVEVKALHDQVAGWESRWNDVGQLRERVAVVEAKPPAVVSDPAVAELRDQVKALDGRLAAVTPEITALLVKTAVLETRAPVPGPAGQDGRDGIAGKDGTDGVGFDDLDVLHDGERGVTFRFVKGDRVKDFPLTFPTPIYREIYVEGKTYQPGDVVTFGGSAWYCKRETTLKPGAVGPGPQSKDFWTLMVKEGREGRVGRDGQDLHPTPVVKTGGGR
jgi:hypothetical protein